MKCLGYNAFLFTENKRLFFRFENMFLIFVFENLLLSLKIYFNFFYLFVGIILKNNYFRINVVFKKYFKNKNPIKINLS